MFVKATSICGRWKESFSTYRVLGRKYHISAVGPTPLFPPIADFFHRPSPGDPAGVFPQGRPLTRGPCRKMEARQRKREEIKVHKNVLQWGRNAWQHPPITGIDKKIIIYMGEKAPFPLHSFRTMIRNTILTTYSIVHKTKTADSQQFPAVFNEKQQKPQILSNFVRNHDKSTVNLPYN